jgi:hypothetical protein
MGAFSLSVAVASMRWKVDHSKRRKIERNHPWK